MTPKYFITNTTPVACIGKCGSTSIGKTILEALYPEKIPKTVGADPTNAPGWQAFVPKVESPEQAIVAVRDPIERFRSACSQVHKSDAVDEILDSLESGGKFVENYHFKKQVDYLVASTTLYVFPDHNAELAQALGLTTILLVNDSSNNPPKPVLTELQYARVGTYYADDISLFNSIIEAGQAYVIPAEAVTDELKQSKKQEIAADRYANEMDGFSLPTGMRINTDIRTRSAITAGAMQAIVDPSFIFRNYKMADNSFMDIDATTVLAIFGAVNQFVTSCFSREKQLLQAVDAANTIAELNAISYNA